MMKIGITTSVAQGGRTGVARWIINSVKALLPYAREHEFHLFVLKGDLPLFEFARESMTIHTVSERCRNPLVDILWHQTALQFHARRLNLDVVHVPSYRRMPAWAPCARVATIHDLAPFRVKGKYDLARTIYGRLSLKRLARRQSLLTAVSPQTARDIEEFSGIPARSVVSTPNGVDRGRFCPGDRAVSLARVVNRYSVTRPYFLYVARIEHPSKNHLRLIEAFEKFRRESGLRRQLVLAGADWDGAEAVHRAAAASPYAEDIVFTGFLPDEDLPHLYRAAEALIFPSLFEGFGIPPVEAMACGCPVASSRAGALKEVVGEAALQLDPHSIDSICNAMNAIAMQKHDMKQLTEAGLQHSRQFTWESTAEGLISAYEQSVAMHFRPAGTVAAKQGFIPQRSASAG